MSKLDEEINTFNNQVVGRTIVSYDGKITPEGAELIRKREEERYEEELKDYIHFNFGTEENETKEKKTGKL